MTIEIAFYSDEEPILEGGGEKEAAVRDEIKRMLGYWLSVCNVHTPVVKVYWIDGAEKDRATCEVDHEYDELHFEFNVARIMAELNAEELFGEVCHESAHVLTWPIWRIANQLLDRLVTENISEGELKKWREDIRDAGELSTTWVHRAILRAWYTKQEADE
jgi:hypothetical protein